MKKPKRIQRRRAKGWTMPKGAVYVGRPSPYGNPFHVGVDGTRQECVDLYFALAMGFLCISKSSEHIAEQRKVRAAMERAKQDLRGRDLACRCRIGDPCHADVLLELANA